MYDALAPTTGSTAAQAISTLVAMAKKLRDGAEPHLHVGAYDLFIVMEKTAREELRLVIGSVTVKATAESVADRLLRDYDRARLGLIPDMVVGPDAVQYLSEEDRRAYDHERRIEAEKFERDKQAALEAERTRQREFQQHFDGLPDFEPRSSQAGIVFAEYQATHPTEFRTADAEGVLLAENWARLIQSRMSSVHDVIDLATETLPEAWLTTPSDERIRRALQYLIEFWKHGDAMRTWRYMTYTSA